MTLSDNDVFVSIQTITLYNTKLRTVQNTLRTNMMNPKRKFRRIKNDIRFETPLCVERSSLRFLDDENRLSKNACYDKTTIFEPRCTGTVESYKSKITFFIEPSNITKIKPVNFQRKFITSSE